MQTIVLTIIDTSQHLSQILIDGDSDHLILGRDCSQVDIAIDEPVISKVHGEFLRKDHRLWYRDCGSRNGTYVDQYGKRFLLQDKESIIELRFPSILRIGNLANSDQMVVILINNQLKKENWKREELVYSLTQIGRGDENHIVLRHPGISKFHCEILKEGNSYILYPLKTTNGLLVNGRYIQKNRKLKDKDVISILDYQIVYASGCLFYKKEIDGISLVVSHISKEVGRGKKRKQILNNVNCEIDGNDFVAIVGGSGAGKTTLMNAISGYEQDFNGHVYCNGIDLMEQFQNLKCLIGYVPQQDIIYENLSLQRMLVYTAKLKMPPDTQKQEIEERIDEVLDMVDLSLHKHTLIRKLSGGQKKRASVAVELLADPKLFFLDEPTSGLDPGTERSLMITLQKLAKEQNKTVIMVTHNTLNLHLCDKVLFMNPKGSLSFCGSTREALKFFQTDDLVNIYNLLAQDPMGWKDRYELFRRDSYAESSNQKSITAQRDTSSALRQFYILTIRYAELLLRDPLRFAILILQPVLIAVLLYIVADKDVFHIYESTKSMLFALCCSAIWIGLFSTIQEICKERVIVKREYMSNVKIVSYLFSKVIVQAVLGFLQAIILSQLFLVLVNASHKGVFISSFHIEIIFTVWLTILASAAMGLTISSVVKSGDKAMTIAPFALIIQLLFSGILFSLKGIGSWISYATISRWSVEALGSISDLNAMDLDMKKELPSIVHEAEAAFEASKAHLLQDWGLLAFMSVVFLICCAMLLKNIAKDKR